jgi:hypothetical protein
MATAREIEITGARVCTEVCTLRYDARTEIGGNDGVETGNDA